MRKNWLKRCRLKAALSSAGSPGVLAESVATCSTHRQRQMQLGSASTPWLYMGQQDQEGTSKGLTAPAGIRKGQCNLHGDCGRHQPHAPVTALQGMSSQGLRWRRGRRSSGLADKKPGHRVSVTGSGPGLEPIHQKLSQQGRIGVRNREVGDGELVLLQCSSNGAWCRNPRVHAAPREAAGRPSPGLPLALITAAKRLTWSCQLSSWSS